MTSYQITSGVGFFSIGNYTYPKGSAKIVYNGDSISMVSEREPFTFNFKQLIGEDDESFETVEEAVDYLKTKLFKAGGGDGSGSQYVIGENGNWFKDGVDTGIKAEVNFDTDYFGIIEKIPEGETDPVPTFSPLPEASNYARLLESIEDQDDKLSAESLKDLSVSEELEVLNYSGLPAKSYNPLVSLRLLGTTGAAVNGNRVVTSITKLPKKSLITGVIVFPRIVGTYTSGSDFSGVSLYRREESDGSYTRLAQSANQTDFLKSGADTRLLVPFTDPIELEEGFYFIGVRYSAVDLVDGQRPFLYGQAYSEGFSFRDIFIDGTSRKYVAWQTPVNTSNPATIAFDSPGRYGDMFVNMLY